MLWINKTEKQHCLVLLKNESDRQWLQKSIELKKWNKWQGRKESEEILKWWRLQRRETKFAEDFFFLRTMTVMDSFGGGFCWYNRGNDGLSHHTMMRMSLLVAVRIMMRIMMRSTQLVGSGSGLTDSSMASPTLDEAAYWTFQFFQCFGF